MPDSAALLDCGTEVPAVRNATRLMMGDGRQHDSSLLGDKHASDDSCGDVTGGTTRSGVATLHSSP
jgi:hypothetical protein